MNLLDLMPQNEWDNFCKEMHDRYAISFGVSDTEGARVSTYANWCNQLCPKVKSNPDSLMTVCAVAARHFTAITKESKKMAIGECDLGLIKIAVPIIKDGTFLGTAGCCGLAVEGDEIDTFMIGKVLNISEEEAQSLASDIAVMTHAQAEELASDIAKRIETIVASTSA